MTVRTRPLVAIHGAPRSGTSWLGQLFNSHERVAYRYQPLFSYEHKGRLKPTSTFAEITHLVADLVATTDDFILQRGKASLSGYDLNFKKIGLSHLVYKEVRYHEVLENLLEQYPNAYGIGIVRHPCSALLSWYKAPKEFDPEWNFIDEWRFAEQKNQGKRENWYGFERWKQLVRLFERLQEKFPERFSLVRYETLLLQPQETLTQLFSRCGLQMTTQVLRFLCESGQRDDGHPYGVFRRHDRPAPDWKSELDSSIIEAIFRESRETCLEQYLSNEET